MDQQGA
jgi:hypothetical protein